MSAHQTGVVVPFGSDGFSPARGRPGARACSCWRGLGAPEPVRNLITSQSKLLKWFGTLAAAKPKVILTHGEDRGRETLAKLIQQKYRLSSQLPRQGEVIEI